MVGILPLILTHQVIKLRDQVVDGAAARHIAERHACVAIRSATIHTTGTLLFQFVGLKGPVDLIPVFDPLQW